MENFERKNEKNILSRRIVIYANYDENLKKAEVVDPNMIESKEFYEKEILSSLKKLFKGKNVAAIEDAFSAEIFEKINEGLFDNRRDLARHIYVYINYDNLEKNSESNGTYMKESKDFYSCSILDTFKKIYKDMNLESIEASVA